LAAIPALAAPEFHRDVEPILQQHCQTCHRAGGSAPMPLESYRQTRPWAKAMERQVLAKKMPPWFASDGVPFANDPSLSPNEIQVIRDWVEAGSPEGRDMGAPPTLAMTGEWNIGKPDAIVTFPSAFPIPKSGEVDYRYIILSAPADQDRWVDRVQVLPGNPAAVHHAVVYIRPRGSKWLKDRPRGVFFSLSEEEPDSFTTSDILFTYTPGASADQWPDGMAKLIPGGSDLVFQMHYVALPAGGADRTRLGLRFAKDSPQKRILTLQLNNDRLLIPPGVPDAHFHVWGTLPQDAVLLSLYPHMHLRGKTFEYRVTPPGGEPRTLLRVDHYDFRWQLTYRLKDPLPLAAGTRIECLASYDNSSRNPLNPDPNQSVRFGFQSTQEMMIGFFDVAVPAEVGKNSFFTRQQ
jgi:hypothetical protein